MYIYPIKAGFPSPAEEYLETVLDITSLVIQNPNSTFFGRVKGKSMEEEGIKDQDIIVIDKSIKPQNGNIVVCTIDGVFVIKTLKIKGKKIELESSNSKYKTIEIKKENEFEIWGTVTWTIHKVRNVRTRGL
ncbi:translesion error-prone DNA polymerase V autoproteolytic subunit (plasmid) [Leptospira noguchii]|nr:MULTISPECIES: translesion error-prone DNA polymerase V autoproteolytic subunit [Leptospira]UOG50893.1 translesion error-prone DNA polymerase V autoproteolytic subunit [Leptospira noguchii]UOG51012.1 translesion error-prone DNA polymerase V autoproteolytic subunit [Leptospira noguchii]